MKKKSSTVKTKAEIKQLTTLYVGNGNPEMKVEYDRLLKISGLRREIFFERVVRTIKHHFKEILMIELD